MVAIRDQPISKLKVHHYQSPRLMSKIDSAFMSSCNWVLESRRKLHQPEENYNLKQGMLNRLVTDTGTGVLLAREPEFSYMQTLNDPQKSLVLGELYINDLEDSTIDFNIPAKTPGKHLKQQTPLASQILTPGLN